MTALSPAYLAALAAQIGATAAFLGGFAATFLAMLLALPDPSRRGTVAIALAAASAVAFVLVVGAAIGIAAATHPDAPRGIAGAGMLPQAVMTGGFLVGLVTLLAGIGLSGWSRSPATGRATSAIAAAGLVLSMFLFVRVG
jgi:hypothetical protein